MTSHQILYIVCFKESNSAAPKIFNASKSFMEREEAAGYALKLNSKLRKEDDNDLSYWMVREMEII